jgi:Haem-binding uptake, Tiki superfamily, ChaN
MIRCRCLTRGNKLMESRLQINATTWYRHHLFIKNSRYLKSDVIPAMMISITLRVLAILFVSRQTGSFMLVARQIAPGSTVLFATSAPESGNRISRRDACRAAVGGILAGNSFLRSERASAGDDLGYKPSKRPFAYRVDGTQPPTLIPVVSAQKEMEVLKGLGKGSGTQKAAIVDDSVNLNNMLNKAVFGTIDKISKLTGEKQDPLSSGPGFASFVCLGLPTELSSADVSLAKSLITSIVQPRSKSDTAMGLVFCPLSAQSALDTFGETGDMDALTQILSEKGVSKATLELYRPLLELARSRSLTLLAMAPESEDIAMARAKGLQYVDPERRTKYVFDPDGFIKLSQEPKFRVYADRSLLKDFKSTGSGDSAGLFFSERILVHETAAGIAAKYATQRPDSMVLVVAPTPDLRFLQGINGRIPRLCAVLSPSQSKVTDEAVTTILLNPSAKETLSKTNFLRLEIGTGPETLDYQSKVADYFWFSFMPKVNMIPRLMNPQ